MSESETKASLPDVGKLLAPLLARVARDERALFLALAERLAAARYRAWAAEPALAAHAAALLDCARREEGIADRIESLHSDARDRRERLSATLPELAALGGALFAGRPIGEQLAIQARGERLGAATWRSLAEAAGADASHRATLLACADLEEASALVLEGLLARV